MPGSSHTRSIPEVQLCQPATVSPAKPAGSWFHCSIVEQLSTTGLSYSPKPSHRNCCSTISKRGEATCPSGPEVEPGMDVGSEPERPRAITHMSGECTVCTWPAYSSLSSMGINTRRPSLSSSLSMMQERGAAERQVVKPGRLRGCQERDHPSLPGDSAHKPHADSEDVKGETTPGCGESG